MHIDFMQIAFNSPLILCYYLSITSTWIFYLILIGLRALINVHSPVFVLSIILYFYGHRKVYIIKSFNAFFNDAEEIDGINFFVDSKF